MASPRFGIVVMWKMSLLDFHVSTASASYDVRA